MGNAEYKYEVDFEDPDFDDDIVVNLDFWKNLEIEQDEFNKKFDRKIRSLKRELDEFDREIQLVRKRFKLK